MRAEEKKPPRCAACGEVWLEKRPPGFGEHCLGCDAPLRSCVNCRFYAASAAEFCGEPAAHDERPGDPEKANRCAWFAWREEGKEEAGRSRGEEARAALEALFAPPPEDAELPAGA